jgi:hypothetical protein
MRQNASLGHGATLHSSLLMPMASRTTRATMDGAYPRRSR